MRMVVEDGGAFLPSAATDKAFDVARSDKAFDGFGCATARNRGAMIADPADLNGPRAAFDDGARAEAALGKWRKGELVLPQGKGEGAISTVGKQ